MANSQGQFYTTNCSYILANLKGPPSDARCVIEPFAGKGDLLLWVAPQLSTLTLEAYDIDPKCSAASQRDTLRNPPDYKDAWILTNPPYLARNKCESKEIFAMWGESDLYKCFLRSLLQKEACKGGILILPAGFFFSNRVKDQNLRKDFFAIYDISAVRYFEESVFEDTTICVVAFSFHKADIANKPSQEISVARLPSGETKIFTWRASENWILGGYMYSLSRANLQIRRHVEKLAIRDGEQQTFMTLNAIDSGYVGGRISLLYEKDVVYPAKLTSRTYATIRITGRVLTEEEQILLSQRFNDFIEMKRLETWSLFLPQFREFDRKRMPFELAYRILRHLLIEL